MTILFLDFFGSDPSKMDQTRKFGEQTSRILEFKPDEFFSWISALASKRRSNQKNNGTLYHRV